MLSGSLFVEDELLIDKAIILCIAVTRVNGIGSENFFGGSRLPWKVIRSRKDTSKSAEIGTPPISPYCQHMHK